MCDVGLYLENCWKDLNRTDNSDYAYSGARRVQLHFVPYALYCGSQQGVVMSFKVHLAMSRYVFGNVWTHLGELGSCLGI